MRHTSLKRLVTRLDEPRKRPSRSKVAYFWQQTLESPLRFELELPPSTNHLYKRGSRKGSAYLDPNYKTWRDLAILTIIQQMPAAVRRPVFQPGRLVSVVLEAYSPDDRRDLDNFWKATLDAFTHAGLWADDRQARRQFGRAGFVCIGDEHLIVLVTDRPITWDFE